MGTMRKIGHSEAGRFKGRPLLGYEFWPEAAMGIDYAGAWDPDIGLLDSDGDPAPEWFFEWTNNLFDEQEIEPEFVRLFPERPRIGDSGRFGNVVHFAAKFRNASVQTDPELKFDKATDRGWVGSLWLPVAKLFKIGGESSGTHVDMKDGWASGFHAALRKSEWQQGSVTRDFRDHFTAAANLFLHQYEATGKTGDAFVDASVLSWDPWDEEEIFFEEMLRIRDGVPRLQFKKIYSQTGRLKSRPELRRKSK